MADGLLNDKTIKELINLGRASAGPQEVTNGTTPYAVIPQDCKVVPLHEYIYNDFAERPHRKKANVKVLDAASFSAYYTLFCDENSRVFADETTAKVLAVLDYHGAGENAPRWGQHRLSLDLRPSEEWRRWTEHNGEKRTQVEFAEFIEDNTPDIVEPKAAEMLEMARTLQAKVDVDYSSAIRTNNGQVQLTYNESIKGTYGSGKIEIPESFTIAIPVFIGIDRVRITARLRYRLNGGKLSIWYDLLRHDVVERSAFLSVLQAIKTGLKVEIINGSPA